MKSSLVCISGVRGYEEDGVAYLHIEDSARGLGFTTKVNDTEYVRWLRVDEYLGDFGFLPQVANEENPHDYYIPSPLRNQGAFLFLVLLWEHLFICAISILVKRT